LHLVIGIKTAFFFVSVNKLIKPKSILIAFVVIVITVVPLTGARLLLGIASKFHPSSNVLDLGRVATLSSVGDGCLLSGCIARCDVDVRQNVSSLWQPLVDLISSRWLCHVKRPSLPHT